MKQTANYGLKKPDGNEYVDVGVLNGNADLIDAAMSDIQASINPILQTITEIKEVSSIPADAASHPKTCYFVTE